MLIYLIFSVALYVGEKLADVYIVGRPVVDTPFWVFVGLIAASYVRPVRIALSFCDYSDYSEYSAHAVDLSKPPSSDGGESRRSTPSRPLHSDHTLFLHTDPTRYVKEARREVTNKPCQTSGQ